MRTLEGELYPDRSTARVRSVPPLATLALAHLAPSAAEDGSPAAARWLVSLRQQLPESCALLGDALDEWERHPPPADGRLHALSAALKLAPVERLAAALAFAAETELMAGQALAWLQTPLATARPSAGLLVCLEELRGRGSSQTLATLLDGVALRSGLLHLDAEERPTVEATLRLTRPLISALAGGEGPWEGVTTGASGELDLSPSLVREAELRAARIPPRFVVRSGDPSEARAFITRLCKGRGAAPAFVACDRLESGALHGLGPWLLLQGRIPVVCGQAAPGEWKEVPAIPGYPGPVLVATGPEGLWQSEGVAVGSWTIPVPSVPERVELWRRAGVDPDDAVHLGRTHRVGAARIGRLAAEAGSGEGECGVLTLADVRQAARRSEPGGLGALAEPLMEDIADEALVLPALLRAELGALEDRCRVRDGLETGLGPATRARYRPGVRALMVGPSGTGKTLACAWLATRLGLALYRVDLAAVSSKYIGETEKNLGELFARAEYAGVVLMFDEADALFGKRTDVKDAHDRYANQQTNYLLQRIEGYDGIVLLTSNSRARFDSAFSRRLDAVIEFPPPQPQERRALWNAHLGEASGLAPAQLNRLAAGCELAGGHIRNAVLAARARAPEGRLVWDVLIDALAAEYRKLGRALPAGLAGGSHTR